MIRCPRCGLRLTNGRCPADLPQLPTHHGREYGTAQQLVHRLGADVTPAMINNWRQRDGLARHTFGREVYSPLDQATAIEAAKRATKRNTGRGRPRRLDAGLVAAA